MKRFIKASSTSDITSYLDVKTKFDKKSFDPNKMFDAIASILDKNNIPTDDLKGNIYGNEYDDEFDVRCKMSWIFYLEDVSKKDFKKTAEKIEDIFDKQFKDDEWFECNCTRYDDSEYTDKGYDVELDLRIHYAVAEED